MEQTDTRILIETIVRKYIRDLRAAPERSIRNLVDLALHFSDGRFQKALFRAAQTMLQNEDSSYYRLVQNVARNVDPERLLTYGMALGYNSCTLGARRIRALEAAEGFNIPWALALVLERQTPEQRQAWDRLVCQGEELGIYSWFLFVPRAPEPGLALAAAHPDSAFTLFCRPEAAAPILAGDADVPRNVMLAVERSSGVSAVCDSLRAAGQLYSVYQPYGEADLPAVRDGSLFREIEALQPVFAVLVPRADCPEAVRQEVCSRVTRCRTEQTCAAVAWELCQDGLFIDRIISDGCCAAGFHGGLLRLENHRRHFHRFHRPRCLVRQKIRSCTSDHLSCTWGN